MPSPWSAVVFDLDGTIIDTVPLIVESYQHTFTTALGEPRDEAWIRSTIGTPLQTTLESVAPGRGDELVRIYLEHNIPRLDQCPVCPGVLEAVQALVAAGVKVGVATAKRHESAVATLAGSGLAELLPLLTTYEDTPRHKPEPDPILHALAQLGVAPSDAAYVGDALVDIGAARAAGVSAIAVATGGASYDDLAAAQPDHLFHTLAELTELVAPTQV